MAEDELQIKKHRIKRQMTFDRISFRIKDMASTLSTRYGLSDKDASNIMIDTLSFVFDQNIGDLSCTLDDLADHYHELFLTNFPDIAAQNSENKDFYKELADCFLNKILRNDGKPFLEKAVIEGTEYTFPLKYIKTLYKDGVTKYMLDEDGTIKYLSTFEFEENLNVEIDKLVLNIKIEKEDYKSVCKKLKSIYGNIDSLKSAVINRTEAIEHSMYRYDIHNEDDDSVIESVRSLKDYQIMLKDYKRKVNATIEKAESFDSLDNEFLIRAYKLLGFSITKISETVNALENYIDVRREYYDNFFIPDEGLDIEKDIFDVWTERPDLIAETGYRILSGLLVRPPKKEMSAERLLQIKNTEKSEKYEAFIEPDEEKIKMKAREKEYRLQMRYAPVKYLIARALKYKSVLLSRLSEIEDETDAEEIKATAFFFMRNRQIDMKTIKEGASNKMSFENLILKALGDTKIESLQMEYTNEPAEIVFTDSDKLCHRFAMDTDVIIKINRKR